ncbi:hypothetical protein BX600DRAFT_156787 [Xylariales sp. PMI_506]|nr:hypothetical protein BX600DRAFT_156787 [Xylariales sp. PMI_506]
MVGTPKSTGCATCRKRKKKCGEERPGCQACVSAGWKCPGYAKPWKFVDENAGLESRYKKKRYLFDDDNSVLVATLQSLNNGGLARSDQYEQYEEFHGSFGCYNVRIWGSLTTEYRELAEKLAKLLNDEKMQTSLPMKMHGAFYTAIPNRLGRNLALDAAVLCICQIYADVVKDGLPGSESSIQQYAESLNALRICVADPHTKAESETICASIMLQFCELLLNTDNGRWNQLCRGTQELVLDCGPARFTSPFERAMLESQRAFFIMQDMHQAQDCFLRQPKWRQLLRDASPPSPGGKISLALRSELCDILVDLPHIFFDATSIATFDRPLHHKSDLQRRERLLQEATMMLHTIEQWHKERLEPLVVPRDSHINSTSRGTPNTTSGATQASTGLKKEPLLAILDCMVNAILINLEQLITSLVSTGPNRKYLDTVTSHQKLRERFAACQSSHAFIKSRYAVATKVLEFSLQLIWSYGDSISYIFEDVAHLQKLFISSAEDSVQSAEQQVLPND